MNDLKLKALEELDTDIGRAMTACITKLIGTEDSVTSMDMVVSVLSNNHQAAIYALVGAVIDNSDGADSLLRDYINQCATEFTSDLRRNISRNLKEHHKTNILDPNAELRDTLLEIARHEI